MKGYEVLEKIEKGEIKEGTKLKIKDFNREIIYKGNDTIRFIEKDKEHEEVKACWFINTEVEVIEENKEIKELNKISYDEFKYSDNKHRFDLTTIEYDKINELVRAVNKLIKEREEK